MTLSRSPLFWLFIAAFAIVVVLVFRKSHPNRSWGFKDFVKNPDLWNAMSEARLDVERDAEAAQRWSADQVAKAVTHFVFDVATSRDASSEKRILHSLGPRVHPAILKILGDQSVRVKLTIPTGTNLLPEAPMNRLCDLLDEHPPADVVDLITAFLNDPSSHIRQDVALVLGNVGTPEIIEPLRKALSDSDEYVRSHALIGLKRAVKGQHLDERCTRELFVDLQTLIAEDKDGDDAAGLLLDFDKQRGTEFLLSSIVFTPASASLHEALKALADRKIPVPRERLVTLIQALEASKLEYPKTYALGEVLRLLGQHRGAEDRSLLEAWMTHPEERAAAGAAAGLLASNGLDEFQQKLWDKERAEGFSALSVPQKYYSAVIMLDGEVNNGGHSQYFVNSSGDQWRDALAGLAAMGSKERSAVFREAVAKFGVNGPSDKRQVRHEQLAKLARKDEALFDFLDSRYYKCAEVIDVLATRYVIQNADAFK